MSPPEQRLGDVCDITMGQAPQGASYNTSGVGLPLIAGAGDFQGGHPAATKFTDAPTKTCLPGDVILGIRASIGEKVIADRQYCLGRGVAGLRPRAGVETRYLWHWLDHSASELASKAKGATFKQVNKEDIAGLPITLPPLKEQRRVANILDQVVALRAKRRAAVAGLTALTRGIFVEMFGNPAVTRGNVPFEVLGRHLLFVTSGSRGWKTFYAPAGSRFIRSFDVRMNYIGSDDSAFVVPPDNAEARRTQVKAGDILLTITGSLIGRVAPVPLDLEGAYISQHVAILRTNPERFDPKFVSFFLSLEAGGQRQIAAAQYGQTKPGLNFEQIRRFEIPAPPIQLQREFVRRLEAAATLQHRHGSSLTELEFLFACLQHRAFRGEL